ncbi:MAG: coniferyl aldehyde dehydrogenase [Kangiellaceae bacterium]|nr:coniferyl aldehyde dehydrogenase [Kangiellaceae bacterium]
MQQQFQTLKDSYQQQPFTDYKTRIALLDKLKKMILENEKKIIEAIYEDFSYRCDFETQIAEIYPSIKAIKHTKKELAKWMAPKKSSVSIWFKPATASIMYQPLGVVGIIVPWNYPLLLSIGPMIAAIAAGNRVMLKMSEFTDKFSHLFAELCTEYMPKDWVQVVNGGPEVGAALSSLPFDHILFTGSSRIGKLVMESASKNLTPVTLELGGKSPTIVDKDFPIETAAQRILFGKLINAGQTCLAPDHVFVHQDQVKDWIKSLKQAAKQFYPNWQKQDLTAVSSDKQFERHQAMLLDAQEKGAQVEFLVDVTEQKSIGRKMAPSVILQATEDMLVLQEEIFGPTLPILTYQTIDEVVTFINKRPRPLGLYLFSYDKKVTEKVMTETISGGVTLNDTILHVSQESLPFGGVGNSGMGHYHGIEGFKTFSKAKSIFKQSRFAITKLMYPPFGNFANRMYRIMRGK